MWINCQINRRLCRMLSNRSLKVFILGTRNRCFSFTKELEMMRDELLLILNGGSDLIYGGAGWICMVIFWVKWNCRSEIVYLLIACELFLYFRSSWVGLRQIWLWSFGPFGWSIIVSLKALPNTERVGESLNYHWPSFYIVVLCKVELNRLGSVFEK